MAATLVSNVHAVTDLDNGAVPTYGPQQIWAEALTSTSVKVWWSNVNSTAGCKVRIDRSTDGTNWTQIATVSQTVDPTTYDVEVTVDDGTNTTVAREDAGTFDSDRFVNESVIAIESGGTMTADKRVRVSEVAGGYTTLKLDHGGEDVGDTATISHVDWMGKDYQQSYVDETVSVDQIYYYRLRTESSGGVNVTDWETIDHWLTKTPPDDTTPATPETFDVSIPVPSGVTHTPDDKTALWNLLRGTAVEGKTLARGDIIELASPAWYEGALTFTAPDTITRASGNWSTDGFTNGDSITVENTDSNDGIYTITGLTATDITVASGITNETPTDAIVWYSPYVDETYVTYHIEAASGTRNDDYILIRGADHASLPADGTRIADSHRQYMPILRSDYNSTPVLTSAASATTLKGEPSHHYYWRGIQFRRPSQAGDQIEAIVRTDASSVEGENTIEYDDLPHHVVFNQCLVDATNKTESEDCIRGIVLNCNYGAVINSVVRGLQYAGSDGQCILSNMTWGPLRIENNELDGDGIAETIMFGGGGNRHAGTGACDATIESNLLTRRPAYDRTNTGFNFYPTIGTKLKTYTVEVISSDANKTIIDRVDSQDFPDGIYLGDVVRIETGGGITAGVYTVLDKDGTTTATQLMIDATNETPATTATMTHGAGYVVKNTIEFKNAHRVLVQKNVMRNCPVSGQRGNSLVFAQKCAGLGDPLFYHWPKAAWDVHFAWNKVVNHSGDISLQLHPQDTIALGELDVQSATARRVTIEQNLFDEQGEWNMDSMLQIGMATGQTDYELDGFICRHNTVICKAPNGNIQWRTPTCSNSWQFPVGDDERPLLNTGQIVGNIFGTGTRAMYVSSGVSRPDTPEECRTDMTDTGTFTWRDNVWVDIDSTQSDYPAADATEAADYAAVGFTDYDNGDYSIDAGSDYAGIVSPAVYGSQTDPGVDYDQLVTYLTGVE